MLKQQALEKADYGEKEQQNQDAEITGFSEFDKKQNIGSKFNGLWLYKLHVKVSLVYFI